MLGALIHGLLRERRERAAMAALTRVLPWFGGIEEGVRTARGELRPLWIEYTTTVSPPVMAASLELCALLLAIARALRPARILDLGSGLSSCVLRRYAAESGTASVVTVDDDPAWLERTRGFLAAQRVPTGDLHLWEAFAAGTPAPFQLVVHDLGSMAVREATLPRVLGMAAPDGIVILDDLHPKKEGAYRDVAPAACRRAGRTLHLLRALTGDSFGRFAGIAIRSP